MEGKVNYTIVGMFIIILTAVIVLSIIWLSSGFSFEKYKTYQIYMQESVSGLNVDSAVEFNGVNVGNVTSVEIDPHNPQLVKLLISIKADAPVSKGTVAKLQTRGLTGVTFLALTDKNINMEPIGIEPGHKYPIIQTAPSLFFRLEAAMATLSKNSEKISNALERLLDDQNLESINEVLVNLRKTTKDVDVLIRSSNKAMNTLQTETLPATYRLFNNLDVMSKNLSDVSAEIKRNPSILIRGSAPPALGPGESND